MKKFKLMTLAVVFSILTSVSVTNNAAPYPGEKIAICHKGHLIAINPNALDKHMAHGDTIPLIASWDACSAPEPVSTPL